MAINILPRNRAPWVANPGAALSTPVPAQARADQMPASAPISPVYISPNTGTPDLYGDASTVPVIVATNTTGILALQRPPPNMRRTLLMVQNQLVGTNLFFAFGRDADNGVSCPFIAANGNLFLDQPASIPQNNLYLFFPIAGLATITYINAPLTR